MQRVILFLVAAVVVLGVGVWGLIAGNDPAGGEEIVLGSAGDETGSPAGMPGDQDLTETAGPFSTTTTSTIYVQVAGEVRRPGVYELPAGARVFEAIRQAGGTTAEGDEESVPLAAVLNDGARVVVPARRKVDEDTGGPSPGETVVENLGVEGAASGHGAGGVSLSRGTAAELESLPGVGPKTAERIIEYREAHGGFGSVDELENVPGIGPVTLSRIRELVDP